MPPVQRIFQQVTFPNFFSTCETTESCERLGLVHVLYLSNKSSFRIFTT